MIIDRALEVAFTDPGSAARSARAAAEAGYDRLYSAETQHDPFLPIALAAGAADVELGTNIAVAFARSPMTLAKTARDLQELTGGRFVLGLGSQVKAHVTRRYSMPWSRPAARMREFVLALRAIWAHWEDGAPLDFHGEFYEHSLSAPLFDPGPTGLAAPKVLLAAVGPLMTEVAGEVADGVLCHAFASASYVESVTLPCLRKGRAAAGRDDPPEVGMPVLMATAASGVDLAPQVARLRSQIAFYASTPAYRGVLEHHGWDDLHVELHGLSKQQRWDDMAALVDDDVLHTMGIVAQADQLAEAVIERYGKSLTAIRLNLPVAEDPETWLPVIQQVRNHRR